MTARRIGLLALLIALRPGALRAERAPLPAGIELRWSAPAGCPDQPNLVEGIELFLDQPLSQARAQQLSIDGGVQGDSTQGYSVKLVFTGSQGAMQRYLEHPDCDKLTEAVALLAALAIDPERVKLRQQSSPGTDEPGASLPSAPAPVEPDIAPSSKPAPAAALQPSDRRSITSVNAEAPRARAAISLSGLTANGLLPSLSPGVGLDVSVRLGHFEAGVGGRAWMARSAPVPNNPGTSVELSLLTAGLRACGVPTLWQWLLLACARADWGAMAGWGEGVDRARTRHAQFAAAGGSLALARTIGQLEPFAGAELSWAAARPRFGVLQEGREIGVFRPRIWSVGGFLGLSYRL